MTQDPTYFMYFPGNYRWSAAFINMIGSAPYGGSDFGELHKIGRLLKGKGKKGGQHRRYGTEGSGPPASKMNPLPPSGPPSVFGVPSEAAPWRAAKERLRSSSPSGGQGGCSSVLRSSELRPSKCG